MPIPHKGGWCYGLRLITQRPKLATHLGYIASMWAVLEAKLADIVSVALGNDAYMAASIYSLIKSEGARLDVIESVLSSRIPAPDFEEYVKLKKRVRRVGDQRDKFMHAIWATSDRSPDAIILVDTRSHMLVQASSMAMMANGSGITKVHSDLFDKHKDALLEYSEKDFVELEDLIQNLYSDLCHFEARLPQSGPMQPTSS